ncbi:MAG: tRNA (5-methylaminomethyl-2-thiouridine)(34)-methyltransferase MnmD [Chitinophagales bacterium]
MTHQVKITADGSATLFNPQLNEHYHSIHGALQESMHVFIQSGLLHVEHKNKINVLEIGLGTGLNALLTANVGVEASLTINYIALEPFPINNDTLLQLNYHHLTQIKIPEEWINKISTAISSGEKITLHAGFTLSVIKKTLEEVQLPRDFDLVYFDAFGPQVQPEIWSENNFQKIFNAMSANGILVTYCAKGVVRRTLKKVGFTVERIPGPPGKREMLRARK